VTYQPPLHRIILFRDLPQFTGLAETRLNELIAVGRFPQPVKLSERRKGWIESEVISWQQARIAERDRASIPQPRWRPPSAAEESAP
jgi:prophage regulatory protein